MARTASLIVAVVMMLLPAAMVHSWIGSAKQRLAESQAAAKNEPVKVAVAAEANESYCTPQLKQILRRVLQSCGLLNSGGGRGCQPADAKNVATMSGTDFNALFLPMKQRGAIIQYEKESSELDEGAKALIDSVFADRRGASYFFVVARSSPEGATGFNSELSHARASAVLAHLQEKFNDPDLQQQVGLLWLGEEFAQLDPSFCDWKRSGATGQCQPEDLNRSAFITWIDCTL